ncbi:acyl-CoA dehydrogenase [bacterium]|nr:acyl-CoA dehydrogenase [bacterium]
MDLRLSARHAAFRDHVLAVLDSNRDKAPTSEHRGLKHPRRLAWQRLLIENGIAARTVPEAYGGFGAPPDILEARIIAEAFASTGLPRPLANQGISMLVPTLLELGTEEQKQTLVRPTLHGEMVWCQGYSEPGSGSDLASLATRAHIDGDDYVINGQKIWTSTAREADMIFCLVRTEADAPKHKGISYLLFSMATPGIEIRPLVDMTGAANFNEVFFTDVRVPRRQIMGAPGEGWAVANATLKHERGMLGDPSATKARFMRLVALMRRETVDGMALMHNPLLRDRLLALQARVFAMQANGLRVTTRQLRNEPAGMPELVVKLQGCELNHEIARLAIDALGELGLLYGDHPQLRDAGEWQQMYMYDLGLIIGGGTAQIQKNIISERGLGLPREPRASGG